MSLGVIDKDGNPQTILTADDLATLIGAISASPASNTMMDRLKTIATALAQNHTDETQLHADIASTLVASLATLATQTTAASMLTALQTLVTDFAAFPTAGPQTVANSTAVCDSGSGIASSWGVSNAAFTSADQHSAAAAVTDVPTSGQKIVVDDMVVSTDTAMALTFTEETSGRVLFVMYVPASAGPMQITPRGKLKLATANKRVMVQSSVSGNICIVLSYHSEA